MSGALYPVESQDARPGDWRFGVELGLHVALQLSDLSVGPVDPSRQPFTG